MEGTGTMEMVATIGLNHRVFPTGKDLHRMIRMVGTMELQPNKAAATGMDLLPSLKIFPSQTRIDGLLYPLEMEIPNRRKIQLMVGLVGKETIGRIKETGVHLNRTLVTWFVRLISLL